MKTVKDELLKYLTSDNSLSYSPSMVNCDPSKHDEIRKIAQHLCGIAGEDMAISFIRGSKKYEDSFLTNVSFNGVDSIPIIIRAIQLHLQNKE